MSEIRYLLDENVDPVLRTVLLAREPNLVIWKVGDPGAPPRGTLDPAILDWCAENTFILVTNNRKSMPQHLHDHRLLGKHIPGILQLSPRLGTRETADELILLWGASEIEEYQDLLIFLPLR